MCSTEATSDVDISTYGDGTEWTVKAFNFLFQALHDGTEPGLATDVNVYGTGFIPQNRS